MDTLPRAHSLSLAAQFDDLCRSSAAILKSHEYNTQHFIAFLASLQPLQTEVSKLRKENSRLKSNLVNLTSELEQEKKRLAAVRHSLSKEIESKKTLQHELDNSRTKIREIRNLLNGIEQSPYKEKLRNLVVSNSNLPPPLEETDDSLSGISYDQSDDDLLNKTQRLSVYSNDHPPTTPCIKKAVVSLSTLEEHDHGYFTNGHTTPNSRTTSTLTEAVHLECNTVPKEVVSPSPEIVRPLINSGATLKSVSSATSIQSHVSLVDELELKKHVFADKPFAQVFKFLPSLGACAGCLGQIKRFGSLKRCAVCGVACHSDCTDKVPLPCLRRVPNPKKKTDHFVSIATYAPSTRPCIPPLIIHCVREIERRGLSTPLLYANPGHGTESKLVRDYIQGKRILNFASYDVNVLCNIVKEFFRSLKEPLISFIFWRDFASALDVADQERSEVLLEIIAKLPGPNIDTIAYLMRHFHLVIEDESNHIEVETIARLFAPFFIGYPSKEPNKQEIEQIKKTKLQIRLMCSLLNDIEPSEWERCLTVETNGNTEVINYWPIRASNARMSTTSRRISQVPCGTIQNGRIERASNKVFS